MANEVQKLQFGDEVFEIPTPNNAEIIIKQGGVEKGRFTLNANEPVEINLDAGGSSDDCVKKTGDTMSGDLVMTDGNPLERSLFGLEVKKTEVTGRRLDYGTSFNVSDDGTFNFLYKSNPSDNITSFAFQQKLVRCFVSQSSTEEKNGAALFIGDYTYSASERALLAIRKIEYNARFTPGIYANYNAIWWGVYDGIVKPIYLGPDGNSNVIYTDGDVQIRQNKAGATGGYEVVHSLSSKVNKYGDTMSGIFKNSFHSDTWLNGVVNACWSGTYTGYGALLNGPTKDGRFSISTYPDANNKLYFGYITNDHIKAGTPNSFDKEISFDFDTGTINGIIAWTNVSGRPTSLPANGGNADTVDNVHLEWSGEQAASSTAWLAGWTSDGKKIKAVNRANLSVNYANSAGGVSWGNVSGKPSGIFSLISNAYTGSADSLTGVGNTGVYRMSTGSSNPNAILIVFCPVDTCCAQFLVSYDGTTYSRIKWYTNSWTSWKKLTP